MAATSSNDGIVAPTVVGTGSGNAAKGTGMAGGKRNASFSPSKLRVSSNLDGRRLTFAPESPSKSDIAAGDTRARSGSKKTRSVASASERSTKAPKPSVSSAGQLARSKTTSLAHQVKALQMDVADAPNASKGATRAPKTVGSPEGRVARSKTTRSGKMDHRGDPNKVQVKAPLAELQSESEESPPLIMVAEPFNDPQRFMELYRTARLNMMNAISPLVGRFSDWETFVKQNDHSLDKIYQRIHRLDVKLTIMQEYYIEKFHNDVQWHCRVVNLGLVGDFIGLETYQIKSLFSNAMSEVARFRGGCGGGDGGGGGDKGAGKEEPIGGVEEAQSFNSIQYLQGISSLTLKI